MTRPGWIVAALVPAAVVAAAAWPLTARRPAVAGTPTPPPGAAVTKAERGFPVGAGGCASSGCHGAPAGNVFHKKPDKDSWKSSAIVWMASDPHRRAYEVLTENHVGTKGLATQMMARLYPNKKPEDRLAINDARCLACHTNPALAETKKDTPVHLRTEGVSCEACHGNASGWLSAHTGFAEQRKSPAFDGTALAGLYRETGMAPLYDLGARALACAGCHVGAPAADGLPLRDMNHDMIAAGHPKLTFDFATYQFMLPRHWIERDRTRSEPEPKADPNFEARAWLVGRVAHAEAACRLTADRARRGPWPEFAESSCVACHHRLNYQPEADAGEAPTYPNPAPAVRRLGSLPWQPIWPVTRAESFAKLDPGPAGGAVAELVKEMQVPRPPCTACDTATTAADELAALRVRLAGRSGDAAFTRANDVLRTADALLTATPDRDLAEQVYYGSTAVERARLARPGRDGVKSDLGRFDAAARALSHPRDEVRFELTRDAATKVRSLLK